MTQQEQPSNPRTLDARAHARALRWDDAFAAYRTALGAGEALTSADCFLWTTAAYLVGDTDVAAEALIRAHKIDMDAGNAVAAMRSGYWLVMLLMEQRDFSQANGWIARCTSIAASEPADSPMRSGLLLLEGFRKVVADHDYEAGLRAGEQALRIGRAQDDDEVIALALNIAGRASLRLGRMESGLGYLDEAMVVVTSDDVLPPVAGRIYCSLIEGCDEIGDVRRAREWTEVLSDWCDRQHGIMTFTGSCLVNRAAILRKSGLWGKAEDEVKRACDVLRGSADERATGRALYELGEVYRVAGNESAAEDTYGRAAAWGYDPQPGLALLRLTQNRVDAAAGAMRRLAAETKHLPKRLRVLPAYVEIMVAAGAVDEASEGADELTRAAETFGTPALEAEAQMARGRVLLVTDRADEALVALRAACATWRMLDMPHKAAQTAELLGEACRDLGDYDAADMEAATARRVFAELGATADLHRMTEHDAGLAATPFGLTPRETEVLRHVSAGRTNQQIADELFIAVKTVDRHVANILGKMDVPSRTAATALAIKKGLV